MVLLLATGVDETVETTGSATGEPASFGFPSAGDELEVKWSGVFLAITAFAGTRILVVDAVLDPMGRTAGASLAGLLPLVLGLALVAYGVSLAVSTHDRAFVRRITLWYLLAGGGMVLVTGGSLLGAGESLHAVYRSSVFAGSVIGGGIGGVLIGRYAAAASERDRQLDRQSDQAVLLNRLLRHEVLNAVTAIRGHAGLLADGEGGDRSRAAVESNSDRIERTIEEIRFLVRTADEETRELRPIALDAVVEDCLRRFEADGADVAFAADARSVTVRADEHLGTAFGELLDAALDRGSQRTAAVTVTTDDTTAHVRITAPRRWLDGDEREALVEALPEFDSPNVGYGISISRLLVDLYGGRIDVSDGPLGTIVEVRLPRTVDGVDRPGDSHGVDGVGLRNATVAGLGAGLAMGLVLQLSSGEMAVIGSLYSVPTLAVGWITHLFHSVVFATLFAAALSWRASVGTVPSLDRLVGLGVAYGLLLWVFAGGVVMSIWLNALGIPAPVPNLGWPGLVGHLVWGLAVAGGFHLLAASGGAGGGWRGLGRFG